jgi:hypothetical protein
MAPAAQAAAIDRMIIPDPDQAARYLILAAPSPPRQGEFSSTGNESQMNKSFLVLFFKKEQEKSTSF